MSDVNKEGEENRSEEELYHCFICYDEYKHEQMTFPCKLSQNHYSCTSCFEEWKDKCCKMFKEMTCPICREVIPKNGFYTFYYENGMKRQEVYYKNDIPHGLVILWRIDGTIHQKFYTENSKYHGLFEEYYPNEILKVRCYYKKGAIVGVYQLYYKSSMLFLECECGPLAGKINGKLEVWDEEGNMIEKYQCKNGRINIVYDDNLNVSYSRKAGVFEPLSF